MNNKNEFQELLEKLLKEQEEKLTKQFEKEKQALIAQHAQREQEWSSLFDAQTQTVATVVADHIGKEVVSSYTAKFGADSEATQHAKEIPYQEHAQVAAQFLKADGQVMTADEFAAKHTSTWDEFNAMGGLAPTPTFDPFKEQVATPAADLDQDTKDVMTAIDYQVQNYGFEDNMPLEADTPTAFSKERTQAAIQSLRANPSTNTPAQVPQAAVEPQKQVKAPTDQVEQPSTSQDEPTGSSITPEMLAAATRSSAAIAKGHAELNEFKTIESYSTMSPIDDRLNIKHLEQEMSQEKFNVSGKTDVLVNYFAKVRDFAFGGKTGEEYRNNAVARNDVQSFLNSFQPAAKQMKDNQESELKLMPFDASDKEVEQMKLKHKVEQAYFEYAEKSALSGAKKLFRNEFLPEIIRHTPEPTKGELAELGDAFKDFVAHKLGKTWKHTYADPKKPRMTKNEIHAAIARNNDARTQKSTTVSTTKTKTLGQIKTLRMSM